MYPTIEMMCHEKHCSIFLDLPLPLLPASLKPTRALDWKLLQVDAPPIPAAQLAHLVQQVPTAPPPALAGDSMATVASRLVGYYNDVAQGAAAINLGIAPVIQHWHLVVVVYVGSCKARLLEARRIASDKMLFTDRCSLLQRTMIACSTTNGDVETHLISFAEQRLARPASDFGHMEVEVQVRNIHPKGGAGNTAIEAVYAHVALVAMRSVL